ncbi:hypothetical protein LCGC14_0867730 [marine sediment metagenome]|uniref:Uncharacterized protein n=1 Tax=marine sediment metagenome TaxID=412755 RepID=A0A0F9SCL3_9ZZZZ
MVARNRRTKTAAKMSARKARRLGFKASVFKKKGGYAVSVTRK